MSNHHVALIYGMILASASGENGVDDKALATINTVCTYLPIFEDFNRKEMDEISASCVEILTTENGIELIFSMVEEMLPENLYETFYALAVEIICVHSTATQEELKLLEIIRHRFNIDRLIAAAIERGAKARYFPPHALETAVS